MVINAALRVGLVVGSVSPKSGGIYVSVRGLAESLISVGRTEVVVVGPSGRDDSNKQANWGRVNVVGMPVLGPRSFGYTPDLLSFLLQQDFDILHSHGLWMYPSIAIRRWSILTGRPYVVSPHGMLEPWALRNSAWKKRIARAAYEDANLKEARCLHALCRSEAGAIRSLGLCNPVVIIPNGADFARESRLQPRWAASLAADARVLLFLGRLHKKKGLENLLEAFSAVIRLSDRAMPWRLVIAGWDDGSYEGYLRSKVRDLRLSELVFFVGPQLGEEKEASYVRADAFVLPSFSEGLPMAVLEAWSYGLPVVMTDECNLSEGFEENAALKVEPDPTSIREGLKSMFEMSNVELEEMGERGRQLVDARFRWPKVAERMFSVYTDLVRGDPGLI